MKKFVLLMLVLPILVGAQVADISDVEKVKSVRSVVDAVEAVDDTAKVTESEIRAEIREAIDDSIINIRQKSNIQAYELSRSINNTENTLYEDVSNTVNGGLLTDVEEIDALQTRIDSGFDDMKTSLEDVSGVEVDFSKSLSDVRVAIAAYRTQIEKNRTILRERDGDLIEKDTDEDGLSDYDEIYLYDTDPEDAYSTGGTKNDGQKVAAGINPASDTEERIAFSDPREDRDAYISGVYSVDRVELIDVNGEKRIQLKGTALPNSYTTLYVYSTPVIVTMKSDGRGEWSYTLDRELENGDHSVYVATVNNSGRLIARSSAIPFTQTAEAAAIGTFGIGDTTISQNSFVQENFVLIILAILLAAIVITLILTGRKKEEEVIVEAPGEEPKNQV